MLLLLESNLKTGVVASNYLLIMPLFFVPVVTLFTLTILFKKCIILLEFTFGRYFMFRPIKTEFICTNCKTHDFIPTDIVLQIDMLDPGAPSYPPMFDCEKV